MHSTSPGTLYIVATPIGNLEDISLRALRILKEVGCVAAEDTRHTRKLLNHFGIATKLLSYYREQETQRAEQILALVEQGQDVAIVSDAGTPGISDPGSVVVRLARQRGVRVEPIPGASALTAALSCAGLEDKPFMFHGFAPPKKNQRRQLLHTLIHADYYAVFYESPHRIVAFAEDAADILGERQVFMARELTKSYEETVQTTLSQLVQLLRSRQNKGEHVIVLSPADAVPQAEMDVDSLIRWYRDHSSLSLKDCCKTLAADLGISRSDIYKRALQIWDEDNRES